MKNRITNFTRYLKHTLVLGALLVFGCSCTPSRPTIDPLAGWNFCDPDKLDKAIQSDYQDYIKKLAEDKKFAYFDHSFEDATGQHAVKIEIPLNGTWWEHVLIYDKHNKRIKTVAGSLNGPVASLAINGQAAAVYGDTTYAVPSGVVVTNGMNTLTAVVNGTQTNQVGASLPVGVNLQYDLNGNLISDGQRTYAYDCANELVQVVATNGFNASSTMTNTCMTRYAYDGFGRRRVRQDYTWGPITTQPGTTCGWVKLYEVRYIYDGMTVLQERDVNNNVLVTYTRGVDLSGTLQGAGGVGGLLARTDNTGNTAYYHSDGNGNVTMLVDGSGNLLAKYLYDSFGNTLGMWGPLAATNTYRFSSKEVDLGRGQALVWFVFWA